MELLKAWGPRERRPRRSGLRAAATPAKAQELKMAQGVDVQIGRDRYDHSDRYEGRRRDDATVGIGPGGVTIGPRQRCRMVTTTVERGDRTITRRERDTLVVRADEVIE